MLESLSYIRLSSLIYFKHFFAIQQRNACQRKCTKGKGTCAVPLPLDSITSRIRRAAATCKQRKVYTVKNPLGHCERIFDYECDVSRHVK